MALHTRAQILDLLGITPNMLSVYIGRGKIILSGTYIDDQIEPNISFIRKWSEKNHGKEKSPKLEREPKGPRKKPVKMQVIAPPNYPAPEIPDVKPPKIDDGQSSGIYDLEKQQKALAIEKIKKENELLDVKIAKAHGDNVPTDLIKPLFAQHSKSMTSAFYNASDVLLARIGQKYKISPDDVASYRGDLVQIINQAIEDSITETKSQLKSIIDEYSQRRGVGEKL